MTGSLWILAAVALVAPATRADDRWEFSSQPGGIDDTASTSNLLTHGVRQVHDVQGSPGPSSVPSDQDYATVVSKGGHSYEVRIFNSPLRFPGLGCGVCGAVDRLDFAGTVLTAGFALDGPGPVNGGWSHSQVVRWISTASNQPETIRVAGERFFDQTASDQYEIELLDTTYFVPRWNQSGTQSTVFLVQNTTAFPVAGNILLYDAGGALVHTEPLAIPRDGVQVFLAASVPALAGLNGSAVVVHTGGYGALAGKAVAVESATGFTFDTPLVPVPR